LSADQELDTLLPFRINNQRDCVVRKSREGRLTADFIGERKAMKKVQFKFANQPRFIVYIYSEQKNYPNERIHRHKKS